MALPARARRVAAVAAEADRQLGEGTRTDLQKAAIRKAATSWVALRQRWNELEKDNHDAFGPFLDSVDVFAQAPRIAFQLLDACGQRADVVCSVSGHVEVLRLAHHQCGSPQWGQCP
ncbi:MAG: hypothetical protein F9K31_06490 [Dokdonella sp.]|nr:MAG: hypothetical protein F9K31_06490 [Dokdonella sp.]